MKIVHTADWHLGQRFEQGHERLAGRDGFLHWLLQPIEAEAVDVPVAVAGGFACAIGTVSSGYLLTGIRQGPRSDFLAGLFPC